MKITHVCVSGPFTDGLSYQENIITKYHKYQGLQVSIIAGPFCWNKDGKLDCITNAREYINENGIPVSRLSFCKNNKFFKKLGIFSGLYEAIDRESPDILFIHGCQFVGIGQVIKYLKNHPQIKVFVDSHADFSNSATNWFSKTFLHKIVWKSCAKAILPYTKKFYGVLPARVDFLVDVYGLPKEKCELLVMGADDEKVEKAFSCGAREKIRNLYGIKDDDFLVMTGGKIDLFKTQTLLLMEAVKKLSPSKVKLIVFGSVVPELQDKINKLCDEEFIQYIGWVDASKSCEYFSAADLVVFPGRHSVFWEEVAGMGIPLVCKEWQGTTHVDMGGNVEFLHNDSIEEIHDVIKHIALDENKYASMKKVAEGQGKKTFLYSQIAKQSIS